MVFSRSEVKRRSKESHDPMGDNPKRTKVHAQRKFAQGSGMNSPIMTPIKEKEKTKPNGTPSPAELLPSKRPTTEDFLSFLCFRGTKALPPRLDFFNEATSSERSDNATANSSKQTTKSPSGVQKIKSRNSGSQIYKKPLPERQTGLQKGNAMRARTASDDRQTNRKHRIERQIRRKAAQRRAKTIRKTHPSILKRLGANRLRAGLRSGGQLPPGSEVGLKTDRKPKRGRPRRQRVKKKMDGIPKKRLKNDEELNEDENIEEEESEDEEEDDEDEEEEDAGEKEKKPQKKTSMTMRTRGSSNSPCLSPKKQSVSSRPSRKTKEAATLYMEMLTKDLRNPDEEFDDEYVRSFPDLPSVVKKEKEEDVKSSSSPRRGNQEKPSGLPNKGSRLKVAKPLKSGKAKEKDEEDEDEPLLKRSQRLQVKKISPKRKANLKLKRQNKLKTSKILSTEKPTRKDLVKRRGFVKKELNTTVETIIDEDDDDSDEDEEKDDFLNSREEKKERISAESSVLKGRNRKKTDPKKNEDIIDSPKVSANKKRKSLADPGSEESEASEEETEDLVHNTSKKMRRSTVNVKSPRAAVNRRAKKSSIDKEPVEPVSRRESSRILKKSLDESEDGDIEFSPKEKPLKRSKRIKNNSDEEVRTRGKMRPRSAKYKEESEEEEGDEDDEEESPKIRRGSLQRKVKNKVPFERTIDKTVRKSVRTQHIKAKTKAESEDESEDYSENDEPPENKEDEEEVKITSKKFKGLRKIKSKIGENEEAENVKKSQEFNQRKNKNKEECDEEMENVDSKNQEYSLSKVKCEEVSEEDDEKIPEKTPKKIKNIQEKKVKLCEESDEEPAFKQKKSGGFIQKRLKSREQSDDEDTGSSRKLRGSIQRKSKNKDDSDEEEVINVKKRESLQRKVKVKNDNEEELEDTNSNKTRTNLQRKNKNKYGEDEEQPFKINEICSNDEDDDYVKKTNAKDVNTKKTKSKEELTDESIDNRTKKRSQLRKSKTKFESEEDDANQMKEDQNCLNKTALELKNVSIKEEIQNKEDITEALNNKLVEFVDVILKKEKEDGNLGDHILEKERNQQNKLKKCTGDADDTEGKLVQGPNDDNEAKSKKNQIQSKKVSKEGDENLEDIKNENESSVQANIKIPNLNEERYDKPIKEVGKKKAKRSSVMNESEVLGEKKAEESMVKAKRNQNNEEIIGPADKGNEKKKEPNEKVVSIKKEKPEVVDRIHQNSKTVTDNTEGEKAQKVRVMPRRSSRKGYEESDDESEHFKVQRKQSLRTNVRNVCYDDNSDEDDEDDDSDEKSKFIEDRFREKELPKTSEALQKRGRKPSSGKVDKKELNEKDNHEIRNKVKIEEVKTMVLQKPLEIKNDIPLTENISKKIMNESNSSENNVRKEDSGFSPTRKKGLEVNKNIPNQTEEKECNLNIQKMNDKNSKSKEMIKIEQPYQKLDNIEHKVQEANSHVSEAKYRLKLEENQKNVHDALSQKLSGGQHLMATEKEMEVNVDKITEERRKGKGKSVLQVNAELKDVSPNKEESAYHSNTKPASKQLDNEEMMAGFSKTLNTSVDAKQMKFNLGELNEKLQGSQKYSSGRGCEKSNLKKGSEFEIKKSKKSFNDFEPSNVKKKPKESGAKTSKNVKGETNKSQEFDQKNTEEKLKKVSRYSFGDNEDKVGKKIDNYEKCYADNDKNLPLEKIDSNPPRVSLRKPSLNARALLRKDDDDSKTGGSKPNEVGKTPALIKRKSVGERDSCDTVGSGSSGIVDCKVVIESLSGDLLKPPKRAKTQEEIVPDRFHGENIELEDSPIKNKPSLTSFLTSTNVDTTEVEKIDDKKELNDKQKPKHSINETWRQAFKNAKIPKTGHSSPVPHTVKPFVRQKAPGGSFTGFPGKNQETPETNVKSKVFPSLSPFKSLIVQNQRSSSPDAKRHLSPAHKANFGFESPVRKTDEIKTEFRKHETPVKSFTQLQYEKRSSEFISSLDSGPAVLPGFESIRAYKKEIKREEIKSEIQESPPASEPAVKPSPEGKHLNLPLAVEHTLRKMSPITVSKKPPVKLLQMKADNLTINKAIIPPVIVDKKVEIEPALVLPSASVNPSSSCQPVPANIDLIVREQTDLSFMAKKKVNMTAEEINRWLNDSTSSGIEHKKDCGIFENNQCECSYRTSGASMQNSVGMSELVPKDDGKIDHGVVGPPVQLKELDKDGKYTAETISTCKVEEYKEKLLSKTENKMAPPKSRRSSGQERFKSNRSMTEEEMCEYDFRFERTSNSPRESVSDVSSVTHRDDVSTSSEIPERKIFHQKRSASNKRPSISSPTAFSAENESSVYAFKPDPPSTTNRPFRRGRGKSGDLDDGKHPSSSSIAVQVNLETESVLESSTQTERSNDDNEGHVFYIPLPDEQLQSGVPQGVAVKLDTEGPDQRVIMRAKLVTKPGSSLPPPSSNSRALVTSGRGNHQKPEQKVRPLYCGSGRAVGAVPPTMREPQTNDQGTTTIPEKPRQPAQVAQSSQSTQASPKGPESPRSRSLTKAQKAAEVVAPSPPPTAIEWKGTEFPSPDIPATLVEAPTFYPNEEDFKDPLEYIEQLTPLAQSFGICRIVPPSSFKPECKVSDEMRFTAYNQYIHKLMERWGPNVRELCAIKKYLATQSISLIQLPMIGSMEVDLPRLYQTVQQCGGLKEVIEKKRWARVADVMRIPKSAQDRVTKLDDIYCKFLLPYDTLSHDERTKLLEEVDDDWREREKRLAADEESGNNGSGEGSEESSDTDDNVYECITKGKSMPLSVFFRIARNTMATWFKDSTPSPSDVEAEFWRHVSTKTCHVCVHCGSIDSGTWGYGFPTTKSSNTSRHPWNLKVLTNSPGSILRSLGPLMGVTVPTLHVGMLFSCCCWYRDPHALPWIEYLHTGASKIWYGVPDSRASELREAMYPLLPRHIRDRKIWLPSDTMMVPPQFLLNGGVSLCRVVQEPGQFILVFPKAFTSSICTGYLVSESVYFAQPSWLSTAVQVFKDIQDSCEPPVFSMHKLLFNIANDTRSSADILIQVLPMLKSVIEKEVESRKKLENLGLTSWERLPSHKSGRRKKKEEEQGDLECDTCRGALFLSVVANSNEDCSYCIDHAVEALSKDQSLLKYCKPMFAYDEEEMEELIDKVKARIEAKTLKKQKEKGGASSGNKN